ncbi:MAG: 30S ribosomal protein S5 [Minisyncoccia bacterium]
MTDQDIKINNEQDNNTASVDAVSNGVDDTTKIGDGAVVVAPEAEATSAPADTKKFSKPREKNERRGGRRTRGREDKPKSEFDHKLIAIRRVSRTVAGGRRFSFSALVAVGNRKGKVGIGQGKSGDTPIAIEKAVRDAKKHLQTIELTKNGRIPHETLAKYSSARVKIMPAPGRGILAGSAARSVLELAGIKEVNAKILSGSKNALNIAQATVKALVSLNGAERVKSKK